METRTVKSKIFIYTLLTAMAVLVVIPFGWMLLASVKTSNEVFSIPMKLFPKEFQWVNFLQKYLQDRSVHHRAPGADQLFCGLRLFQGGV